MSSSRRGSISVSIPNPIFTSKQSPLPTPMTSVLCASSNANIPQSTPSVVRLCTSKKKPHCVGTSSRLSMLKEISNFTPTGNLSISKGETLSVPTLGHTSTSKKIVVSGSSLCSFKRLYHFFYLILPLINCLLFYLFLN